MPFGIDIDFEKAGKDIGEFLLKFGAQYMKSYSIALVNKKMEDALAKKEGEAEEEKRQLSRMPPPKVPDKRGMMKKQSAILGRWKPKFFWVKDNYDLAFSEKEGGKEDGVINLWGYKVQSIQYKPEGPRRGGPEWIPDEERPNCVMCNKAFSAVVWHHHCRMCGEVFCGDCADQRVPLTHLGYDGMERVCKKCYQQATENARRTSVAISPQELKEEAEFHGIQLLHVSRTPYVLQCETLKEKKEWMEVFEILRKNAQPPVNSNPIMASAFMEAHKELCPTVGWYWYWRIIGSEEEMMAELVQKLVDSTIVTPAISGADAKIPEKVKRMAITVINKQLKVVIGAAVKPAWKGLCDQIKDRQAQIEEKIAPIVDPVSKVRNEISTKVKDKVVGILDPLMEKFGKVVLNKVVPLAFGPAVEAYENIFAGLQVRVKEIAKKADSKAALDREIEIALAQLPSKYGPIGQTHEHLEKMADNLTKAKENTADVLSEFSVSKNVDRFSASAIALASDVLFTIANDPEVVAQPNEHNVLSAWKRTTPKLLHDAVLDLTSTFKALLSDAVMAPVQSKFLSAPELSSIVEPIDSLIPDAVKEFVSVNGLIQETVEGIVGDVVNTAVGSGMGEASDKLAKVQAVV